MIRWWKRRDKQATPPTIAASAPTEPAASAADPGAADPLERSVLEALASFELDPARSRDTLAKLLEQVAAQRGPSVALASAVEVERRVGRPPWLLAFQGKVLVAQQRFDRAEPLLVEAAKGDAIEGETLWLLASCREARGDARAAIDCLDQLLAIDFGDRRARARLEQLRRRVDLPGGHVMPTLVAGHEGEGRYTVRRQLGSGGGGAVFLAHDAVVDRLVAVKMLHGRALNDARARSRLFHEARLAAAIAHPRIVTVYDLDEARNVIVMEYCAGGTLRELIQEGALPRESALHWLRQMLRALRVVHHAGIVHRDVKPANFLRREAADRSLVLTDFGIAHLHEEAQERGAGTEAYLAPELKLEGRAELGSDLYACGVITTELLLGRALSPAEASDPSLFVPSALEFSTLRSLLTRDPSLRPSATLALASLDSPEPIS